MSAVVQVLIGINLFITLWFTWPLDYGAFKLHIVLCVIGYHLLASNGILILSSSTYNDVPHNHKNTIHSILQAIGAPFYIAGTFVMMTEKGFRFNSLHGICGLAALIFSCLSLINGIASLYTVQLRRFIPPKLTKISHTILGTTAFALSSTCLALGYNKNSFKNIVSTKFAYVMMGIVCFYTVVVVFDPCWKLLRMICRR